MDAHPGRIQYRDGAPPILLLGLHLVFGRMMRVRWRSALKIAQSSGSILSWVLCIAGLILVLNSIDNCDDTRFI